MTATRLCAEAGLRPNLCEVTCRRDRVGRTPCEVVCDPPVSEGAVTTGPMTWADESWLAPADGRVILGVDPAAGADAFVALVADNRVLSFPRSDLSWFNESTTAIVRQLADAYTRPTFFNQPIGVDHEGTAVYWSDIVDENIAAADVRITL